MLQPNLDAIHIPMTEAKVATTPTTIDSVNSTMAGWSPPSAA
jgi:hypothetical protein